MFPTATVAPTPIVTLQATDEHARILTATPTQRYSFDGRELNRTQFQRLSTIGSYAARSNLSVHRPDHVRHVNVSYAMDLPNDREFSVRVFTYRFEEGDDALFPVTSTYTERDQTWVSANSGRASETPPSKTIQRRTTATSSW